MIVSWNELQRTCQKAFRGLGVPAGADDESSFAVLWLEARGLDALTRLDAALSALERASPRPLRIERREDEVDVLDAGGQPAVSVASDALDLAVARTVERKARVELLLTGIEGAILVAGALAQRPRSGRCSRVEWREGMRQFRLDMASAGACRLSLASFDPGRLRFGLGRQSVRIVIDESDGHQWMERGPRWRIDADETELDRRATQSATRGIDIPDALWSRLLVFAKRTLVPATHASRERGAGGGEYND
ncbi:MAG: DUF3726 domain-containing protein [Thiotrichales bacterium]|nr:DUF3726 domain-containing protein [Thiotrichales bacterium]